MQSHRMSGPSRARPGLTQIQVPHLRDRLVITNRGPRQLCWWGELLCVFARKREPSPASTTFRRSSFHKNLPLHPVELRTRQHALAHQVTRRGIRPVFDDLPCHLRCHPRQPLELCGRCRIDIQRPLPYKPFGNPPSNRARAPLRRRRRISRVPLKRFGIVRRAPRQKQDAHRHRNNLNHRG
jgi:hypothetical protein